MQRVIVLFLLGTLTHLAAAQTASHQLSDGGNLRLASLPGGAHLILAERTFGIDSSHAVVLLADADWNVTPLAARRFQDPLWYLFDAVPTPSGMVAAGHLPGGNEPQLHAVGTDGTFSWAKSFAGMSHFQRRIGMLFSEGAAVHGYTSQDGFFGSGMYRVGTDAGGSAFTFAETVVSGSQFRFYLGADAGTPGEHLLGGAIRTSGTNDYDVLLGRFTAGGAAWMKRFDLGSPDAGTEQVTGALRLADGSFGWAMYASGSPARGYFLRTDASGTPLGGTVIEHPQGVITGGIAQLGDGSVLIAGTSASGTPRLFRLSGAGGLLSAAECTSCSYGGVVRFHRDGPGVLHGLGNNTVHTIGSDGEVCGYVPMPGISATAFAPLPVNVAFTNNPSPAVTASDLTMLERTPVGSMAQVCGSSGSVEENAPQHGPVAHPSPCAGRVWLGAPGEVAWNEPVEVRDLAGALAISTTYAQGIDVHALVPGIYVAVLPRTARRSVFVKAAE